MNFAPFKKIITIGIILFTIPFFSYAQSVEIDFSPKSPKSGQLINVSVSSFSVDLNNSEISWYRDGKFIQKGVGAKNFSFPVNDGDNLIRASIKSEGKIVQKTLTINTSDLDLLWEVTDSYEPPFYKGKLLPIKSSLIKVSAIPQMKDEKGFIESPDSFVYTWQKNGSNFSGQSGYGKSSFSYPTGLLDSDNNISLNISGLSKRAKREISVGVYSTEIHLYEYSSIYGPLYNKAFKNGQRLTGNKVNIIAEPYFAFTKDINNQDLDMTWKVSGNNINPDQKNIALLDLGGRTGNLDITLEVNNKSQLLQRVSRSLRLNILKNE